MSLKDRESRLAGFRETSAPTSVAVSIARLAPPPQMDRHEKSSNERSEIRKKLAISRAMMAADRMLMARIRTSLSLDSFGFTTYKLLDAYLQSGVDFPKARTARTIGLLLPGVGTCGIVMDVFTATLGVFLCFGIITTML